MCCIHYKVQKNTLFQKKKVKTVKISVCFSVIKFDKYIDKKKMNL